MKNMEKLKRERFESFLSEKFTLDDAKYYLKSVLKLKIKDGEVFTTKVPGIIPSIAYEKTYDRFVLNYLAPSNMGMQHFYFDGNNFCSCYNQNGNENLDSFFFRFNANSYVRLIFYAFQINPTVLHKAYRQNKNLKRKIDLEVKKKAIFWIFEENRYIYFKEAQKREIKPELVTQDNVDSIANCIKNMSSAIDQAIKSYDLSYFDLYFENALELAKLSHKPTPNKDALFRTFLKSVEKSQL